MSDHIACFVRGCKNPGDYNHDGRLICSTHKRIAPMEIPLEITCNLPPGFTGSLLGWMDNAINNLWDRNRALAERGKVIRAHLEKCADPNITQIIKNVFETRPTKNVRQMMEEADRE